MGESISKNTTSLTDFIKGFLSTVALILFSYDHNAHSHSISDKLILGYILLAISLMADGLLSLKEKLIKTNIENDSNLKEYKSMTSWYFMFTLNLTLVFITLPVICKLFLT